MRILFIENTVPVFSQCICGASVRSYYLISALARLGFVDIISLVCPNEVSNIENSKVVFSSAVSFETKNNYLKLIRRLLTPWRPETLFTQNENKCKIVAEIVANNKYDFIVTRYLKTFGECGLQKYANRLVLDVDDNPKSAYRSISRSTKILRKRLYFILFALVADVAVKNVAKQILVMFHSNQNQIPSKYSVYLPNTAPIQPSSSLCDYSRTPNNILFVGGMRYYPNYLGVDYFITNVFGAVKAEVPDVTFTVVGKGLPEEYQKKWETIDGLVLKGYVPQLEKEYRASRLSIVPIYLGAGSSVKFIESICYNRPCVSTPFGVRGNSSIFVPGEDYLLAKDKKSFARQIIALLNSEGLNHRLCLNALAKVTEHFSPEVFYQIVKGSIAHRVSF